MEQGHALIIQNTMALPALLGSTNPDNLFNYKSMLKTLFFISGLILFTGIYDYTIKDINGNEIPLSDFRGKKILLVNTASTSKYTEQYASLEKLYQQYKDSLVII